MATTRRLKTPRHFSNSNFKNTDEKGQCAGYQTIRRQRLKTKNKKSTRIGDQMATTKAVAPFK